MAESPEDETGRVGFDLRWRLVVDHEAPERLEQALGPETDEHAVLSTEEESLTVEGEGTAGQSLHTLDDVLACLTGALSVEDVE